MKAVATRLNPVWQTSGGNSTLASREFGEQGIELKAETGSAGRPACSPRAPANDAGSSSRSVIPSPRHLFDIP